MKKITTTEILRTVLSEMYLQCGISKIAVANLLSLFRSLLANIKTSVYLEYIPCYDYATLEKFILANSDTFEYEEHYREGDDYIKYSEKITSSPKYSEMLRHTWCESEEVHGYISGTVSLWLKFSFLLKPESYNNFLINDKKDVYEYFNWITEFFLKNKGDTIKENGVYEKKKLGNIDNGDINHIRHLKFFVDEIFAFCRKYEVENVGVNGEAYVFKVIDCCFEIGRKNERNSYNDYVKLTNEDSNAIDISCLLFEKITPLKPKQIATDEE